MKTEKNMSYTFIDKLPTPEEICEQYPVPAHLVELKRERDAQIRKVFTNESDKFILIIGPCSADNEQAVCDYTERLGKLQEKVKDRLILIPRIYTNKPRTTGEGYKGIFHQPDPEKKSDFVSGLIAMRKMHIDSMEVSGLTAADEMLYSDAKKEFSLSARTGFGFDGASRHTIEADFEQVRGEFETNPFVTEVQAHIQRKSALGERIIHLLETL